MNRTRDILRCFWVYPIIWLIAGVDWLIVKLPAKRWAKRRPGDQT